MAEGNSEVNLPPLRDPVRGIVARAYSPRGTYWRQPFVRADAAYVNEGDLIWTATTFDDGWQENPDEYYSELDLLKLEEVRLISALTLPVAGTSGTVIFHPMPCEVLIAEPLDLGTESARSRISAELRGMAKKQYDWHDYLRLPPCLGGSKPYEIREIDLPEEFQSRMYERINVNDHLLIRGLNAIIRHGILRQYGMFLEEATCALHVSMEASFSLIRRWLIEEGNQNPSAHDVAAWLHAAFNNDYEGGRYFEEYYDDRIRTAHPESRLGVFPFAPLAADDCYGLYYHLREVYNLLIFGEVIERPVV